MSSKRQNAFLTYKANLGIGRHDWLRLTPAYSVHLVQHELLGVEGNKVILDPFSGTGTTGLCSAETGLNAFLIDVNPFLIWLAKTKTANYSSRDIENALKDLEEALYVTTQLPTNELWTPSIHNIERWWHPSKLLALSRLRGALDIISDSSKAKDLLLIAFCNILIKESNASFNHQSMSFKRALEQESILKDSEQEVFERFKSHATKVIESASKPLAGTVSILEADSRNFVLPQKVDKVITFPPYVNRMSYIRELRPYMYWLRYLDKASEAGELDWKAIGGTWGTATSKLSSWHGNKELPIKNIQKVTTAIERAHDKHGKLLANYVLKYFHDMWNHFESTYKSLNEGGDVVYIVGNSTFYGNIVPAEKWYEELMQSVGFKHVKIDVIRKRNSNKSLYEFAVRAKV